MYEEDRGYTGLVKISFEARHGSDETGESPLKPTRHRPQVFHVVAAGVMLDRQICFWLMTC